MRQAPILNAAALGEDSVSRKFLSLVEGFDELTNAPDWAQSSRTIGIISAVILYLIHKIVGKKFNVNWCSFVHAVVVGKMSFVAVWLNVFGAELLTGTTEPLGAVLCQGPLTTFHSIVPAVSMGFGIFDLAEGIGMAKLDFILHGVATLTIMTYFCEYHVPEIITPMLLMEISTINLVFMGATDYMKDALNLVNMVFFVLSFTIVRVIVCPYLWWGIFKATWDNRNNPTSQQCLPWHFTYIVFLFGMFFNCLNAFWFYKIIKKVKRKLSGAEKWKAKNHVKEN